MRSGERVSRRDAMSAWIVSGKGEVGERVQGRRAARGRAGVGRPPPRTAGCRLPGRRSPAAALRDSSVCSSRPLTSRAASVSESGLSVMRRGVAHPAGPARRSVCQLGPGSGEDEERDAGGVLDEVLEEVEQREIRPVQVLDDEHRRNALGDRLEERAPGGERLGALDQRCRLEADERQQALLAATRPSSPSGSTASELVPGDLGRVALEDARVRLDDLAERPERDSVAVRAGSVPAASGRAPCDGRRRARSSATCRRLADARLADDGDELHRAVANGAGRGARRGSDRSTSRPTNGGRVRPDDVAPETSHGSRAAVEPRRARSSPWRRSARARPTRRLASSLDTCPRRPRRRRRAPRTGCRAAVLTTSPVTIPSPCSGRASERDERLARVDADPHLERERRIGGVELVERLENPTARPARRARHRPRAQPGAPKTAMTASPMNFSTTPP